MPVQTYNIEKAKEHINKLDIPQENKISIFRFNEYQSAQGLSKARQVKYLYILCKVARMIDMDFSKATKNDIVKLCSMINNSDYKEWTKHDYMVIIKRFYKWLKEDEGQDLDVKEYPMEVKWITPKKRSNRQLLPKELLTLDEIKILANNTNNLRDRCLILLLYESGARIGELLNIRIKDFNPDKYGAKIDLFGKTGSRNIRLIASAPAISTWLLEHPRNKYNTLEEFKQKDKDAFLICGLWGKNKGNELNYRHVNKLLKEVGERAGISKPMNPHHYRHSRATELAKKLTESQLCQYLGWVQGSKEASTYVHMSGRDVDDAILMMHGLVDEEKKQSKFKPIICPRCSIKNDPAARFCSGCSLGLDEKSVMDYDKQKEREQLLGSTTMDDMLKSPEMEKYIGNLVMKQIKDILSKNKT